MFRLGDVYYILQVKKYTQFGYMYNVYPAKFRENLPLTNQLKLPPLLCLSRLYMKSFLPLPPCCVCVCVFTLSLCRQRRWGAFSIRCQPIFRIWTRTQTYILAAFVCTHACQDAELVKPHRGFELELKQICRYIYTCTQCTVQVCGPSDNMQ